MKEFTQPSQAIVAQITQAVIDRQGEDATDGEIRFLCPAHDDHAPSASWNKEKLVWHCFACHAGGSWRDLAEQLEVIADGATEVGLNVHMLAKERCLDVGFLKSLGLRDGTAYTDSKRIHCVEIPYFDLDGTEVAVRKRLSLNGPNRFKWRKGDKPRPYGLERLGDAAKQGYIWLVEGESDCWALWEAGRPCPGYSRCFKLEARIWAVHRGS